VYIQQLVRLTRQERKWSCLLGCLILGMIPLLCMTFLLFIYVLFPPRPTDLLILGVDARPGERYLTRTDSIMLLNVSPADLSVTVLSIPRDVFIEVPGYGEQRINTINVLGEQEAEGSGPDLVRASLYESFGVDVDSYVRIDFQGFAALVDAVGGVDIDIPKLIIDYEYPTIDGGTMTVRFDPGREHMDGERALQYARTRHQDGDYQRAARQQQVMAAIVKKLFGPGAIIYGPRVWQALQAHTDTDLGFWDMLGMGPGLLLGWSSREHRVLEGEDLIGTRDGHWIPDYARLAPWFDQHFD
jgi:LCP family protein required for cell wall assembly